MSRTVQDGRDRYRQRHPAAGTTTVQALVADLQRPTHRDSARARLTRMASGGNTEAAAALAADRDKQQ